MNQLNKVLSGIIKIEVDGYHIIIEPFSVREKYLADIYSEQIYQTLFQEGCLTEEEALDISDWYDEDEVLLKQIPNNIERMKLDYFNNFRSQNTKDYIKSNILAQEDRLENLLIRKSEYFRYTCEYAQKEAYITYLLEKYATPHISVMTLMSKYQQELLSDCEIRAIAKSMQWKVLWGAAKEANLFPSAIEMTDMQLTLVNWARVYDSVHESMDCPSDEVIEDDYAIDGWFVSQRNKRREEQKKSQNNSTFGNKGGEMLIPAHNLNEIEAIHNLNDNEGKNKIRMLKGDLDRHGSIDEQKRTSVKQELMMAVNRAAKDKMKR